MERLDPDTLNYSTKFTNLDIVQIEKDVNVRNAPYGNILKKTAIVENGEIINGADYSGGYWWWQVKLDNGQDVWVAESFIQKVNSPPPPGNLKSLDLEATNTQYAAINDNNQIGLDLTSNLTIEAWVNFESYPSPGDQSLIAGKDDIVSLSERQYFFKLNTNGSGVQSLELRLGSSGVATSTHVDWTPNLNQWYHVAVTRERASGEVKFYVDGTQFGGTQNSGTRVIQDTDSPFAIGTYFNAGNSNPQSLLDGLIDDVRVWNVVRSASAISSSYTKELVGTELGLVGYWPLNGDYQDKTANGNHLAPVNNPVFSTSSAIP